MSRIARFKVPVGVENRPNIATVEIDRAALTISVRLHKRRRIDTLPLAVIAEQIWWRFTKAAILEKKNRRRKSRS